MQDDIEMDCDRCGKRRHSFYNDPVGDLLSYLCEPRPWCNKVVAIAHNAKTFDSLFILKRAIFMKWNPEIILSGLKIFSMKIQHIHFLDSLSYLPMPLRKLPKAFGFSVTKSWFPHYWNTKTSLDYVGPITDIKYFGADEMSEGERERISCIGIMSRKIKSLITGPCWNSIAKMTSPSCGRRTRFSGAILWRLEISRFSYRH